MRLQDKAALMHEEVADIMADIRLLERRIKGQKETLRLLYKSLMATSELIKGALNGELEKKEEKYWIVGGDIAVPRDFIREAENIVLPQ
ncbi:MAG: hypothetical protein C4570_04310 [Ammonifex sp.]|jgi:hypothetical protein|nr:MAG: hypothetical protein C4570_04310 [Ammonifex sp.]